ncbi:hypothetical protein MSKU15_1429 [Komagataeibacter diospyri]|uniref:hypothetical protein n=1 Tax=Komagataeibacter diospyri TaxID=1932662 RepID=UPI0011339A92|nr:hypothetical protein [Komagataeibacter diospyri]GCE89828.1 hypothetical protein MSKU15_1429 [Komagataeibacter diospyri]
MPNSFNALAGVIGAIAARNGSEFRFLEASFRLGIAATTGVPAIPDGLNIRRIAGLPDQVLQIDGTQSLPIFKSYLAPVGCAA